MFQTRIHRRLSGFTGLVLIVAVLFSCATAPATASAQTVVKDNIYAGTAQSESLLAAMNGAKLDAVRKSVVDIIGQAGHDKNKATLDKVIFATKSPNQFVFADTMKTIRKDNVAPQGKPIEYLYELTIKVNVEAVRNTLAANGLLPPDGKPAVVGTIEDQGGAKAETVQAVKPAVKPVGNDLALTAKDMEGINPDQQRFIREYVDQLKFMVYFDENSTEDPRILKAGVAQANAWLAENAYTIVDAGEIEKSKKEDRLIYEAETGGQYSVTQWIAQSQNADIYLEFDASLVATSSGKSHVGKANLTIKIFDTSTKQLLGSVPYSNPGQVSLTDAYDAKFQALSASVWQAIPVAVQQARNLLAKQLIQGVRYEIVIQKTPDRRTILDFQNKIKNAPNVKNVKSLPSAKDETNLEVYYFGSADDLEIQIYDTAAIVSGLNNMDWVSSRGKKLTFTSGM